MNKNLNAELSGVFVPELPICAQTNRDGSVNPEWLPWTNAINTFLAQATNAYDINRKLAVSRVGNICCITGKLESGQEITCLHAAYDFNVGKVKFSKNGIKNEGDEVSLSVAFISGGF